MSNIYSGTADLTMRRPVAGGGMFIKAGERITKPLKAKPATQYPAGYFSEPVAAWKQLRFEPSIQVRPDGRFLTSFQMTGESA